MSVNWMDTMPDDLVVRMAERPISIGEYAVDNSPFLTVIIILFALLFV